MAEDWYKLLIDEESKFSGLQARQDRDKDLLWLKAFKMLDKDNREIPNVLSVTLNDAWTFADRVIANLLAANMQRVFEPMHSGIKLEDKDSTALEQYDERIYECIDDRLSKSSEIDTLREFGTGQISIRGWVGARCLINVLGKTILPDILPVDTRYLIHKKDAAGLKWVSWNTEWTREEIQARYNFDLGRDKAFLRVMCDRDYERVLLEKEVKDEQKHGLGYVPFVIKRATRGTVLQESDGLAHTGESIFAGARDLYEVFNEVTSILRNLTYAGFFAGMQIELDDPSAPKPKVSPWGVRFVAPTPKGTQYRAMPFQDVKNATRLLYSILESRLQRATLSAVDYGNLQFPLSAVAISRLTENRDLIYVPCLQGLALFYRDLSAMIRKQHAAGGVKAKLEGDWYEVDIDTKLLKREDIKLSFEFHSTSPEQNIANYAVAEAASSFVDDDTIRRVLLKLENPDEVGQKRWADRAAELSPIVAMIQAVKALVAEERNFEAELMAAEMGVSLEQILGGNLKETEVKAKEAPKKKALVPLMGGQGGAIKSQRRTAPGSEELEGEE